MLSTLSKFSSSSSLLLPIAAQPLHLVVLHRATCTTTSSSSLTSARNSSYRRTIMTGNDGKVNATGLTAQESRSLPTRKPNDESESKIIQGIRELYLCKPSNSTYDIYAENAVFHDPVSIAEGLSRIRAQFNALPKLFPRSTIDKFDVLESPKSLQTNSIVINQDVTYYRSEKPDEKPFKTMNSLLTLLRDNQGKVIKHTEEWNHENLVDSSNSGFLGTLNEARKKAFAALSMPFVDQTAPEDRK